MSDPRDDDDNALPPPPDADAPREHLSAGDAFNLLRALGLGKHGHKGRRSDDLRPPYTPPKNLRRPRDRPPST